MAEEARVVLLEFNEIVEPLIGEFIAQGHLPNFARFRRESELCCTDAGESPPRLEPWIQWVTVHTGLPFAQHGVFRLDEGHLCPAKRVWDLVSDQGQSVLVFSSMNVNYAPSIKGCVIPDPWSTNIDPYPAEFAVYQDFVRRNVQEHTNENAPIGAGDYLKFAGFMATHGLSFETMYSSVAQILRERLTRRGRWRRATLLDKLQWDLFRWLFVRTRPKFSTFFLNSTAHFQHFHWREMRPDAFPVKPSPEALREYRDAILFGYQHMDLLLGKFMQLAGSDVTLVLASALSQQPMLQYEDIGGKRLYRPHDFAQFLAFCGISEPYSVAPVMSEQFYVRFHNEAAAQRAEGKLLSVQVAGQAAMLVRRQGNQLFVGCQINSRVEQGAVINQPDSGAAKPFFDLLYELPAVRSGRHHPDGLFWIRKPTRQPSTREGKIPLPETTRLLLDLLGLPKPAHLTNV